MMPCWALRSSPSALKFVAFLALPALWAQGRGACFCAPAPRAAAAALRCHVTQTRWYRSLFVALAATAYGNRLDRIACMSDRMRC